MVFYKYIVPLKDIRIEGGWHKAGQVARVYNQLADALVAQRKARLARSQEIPREEKLTPKAQEDAAAPAGDAGAPEEATQEQERAPIAPEDLPEGGPMAVEAFAELAQKDLEEARDYARPLGVTARGRDELVERYEDFVAAWLAGDQDAGQEA